MFGILVLALAITDFTAPPIVPPVVQEPSDLRVRDTTIPATPMVSDYGPPPTEVRCAEAVARFVSGDPIPPTATVRFGGTVPPAPGYRFRISAEGRLHALRRDPPAPAFYIATDDETQAAMATWRFAPGQALTDCAYRPVAAVKAAADTDRQTLLAVIANRTYGTASQAVYAAAREPSADCYKGERPAPRLIAYPDFDKVHDEPGRRSWSAARYDIDAHGRAVNVRTIGSSGNAALDAETIKATRQDQFRAGKPRAGCFIYFNHNGDPLPAPPRPDTAMLAGDALQDCPRDVNQLFKPPATRSYPTAFSRRQIEGWALVRFDVAPWGQIGAVEMVAAEPAEAFGVNAVAVTQISKALPGKHGYKGCLFPITYKIDDANPDRAADYAYP